MQKIGSPECYLRPGCFRVMLHDIIRFPGWGLTIKATIVVLTLLTPLVLTLTPNWVHSSGVTCWSWRIVSFHCSKAVELAYASPKRPVFVIFCGPQLSSAMIMYSNYVPLLYVWYSGGLVAWQDQLISSSKWVNTVGFSVSSMCRKLAERLYSVLGMGHKIFLDFYIIDNNWNANSHG